MKPRRIILTLECQTVYTLAEIRAALQHVLLTRGRWITRYPDGGAGDGMPNRIVQVQVNAIKPEPQPRSQRARMDKFAKADAERADPKRPGWFSDRIAEVQTKPERDARYWRSIGKEVERKAKRAKGAK